MGYRLLVEITIIVSSQLEYMAMRDRGRLRLHSCCDRQLLIQVALLPIRGVGEARGRQHRTELKFS